eukprot:Skav224476  [mRNA]  locus=scaffold1302:647877:649746:- [translate_table: standard]
MCRIQARCTDSHRFPFAASSAPALPREKGTVDPSGNDAMDTKRCACINKVLAFDGTIDYQNDFSFLFPPGMGSRPRRLIKHLISSWVAHIFCIACLDCLDNLDRIHRILFPDSRPVTDDRSRSPARDKKYTMYHGTSREAAAQIELEGFKASPGGMLGSGVYASRGLADKVRAGHCVLDFAQLFFGAELFVITPLFARLWVLLSLADS